MADSVTVEDDTTPITGNTLFAAVPAVDSEPATDTASYVTYLKSRMSLAPLAMVTALRADIEANVPHALGTSNVIMRVYREVMSTGMPAMLKAVQSHPHGPVAGFLLLQTFAELHDELHALYKTATESGDHVDTLNFMALESAVIQISNVGLKATEVVGKSM